MQEVCGDLTGLANVTTMKIKERAVGKGSENKTVQGSRN